MPPLKHETHALEFKVPLPTYTIKNPGAIVDPRNTNEKLQFGDKFRKIFQLDSKLKFWDPENNEFWKYEGKEIAFRNLIVSILNLLLSFAVWTMWSVLIIGIQKVHDQNNTIYSFNKFQVSHTDNEYRSLLYNLPAIAGLSGATFRISNSFAVAVSGGRILNATSAILNMLPCIIVIFELRKSDPSFIVLIIAAFLSGIGGGHFSSSMPNISYFFPKSQQGMALGLNAGIGNTGVPFAQLILPLLAGCAFFGETEKKGSLRLYNGPLFLWILLVISCFLSWFLLNDLPQHANFSKSHKIFNFLSLQFTSALACSIGVTASMFLNKIDIFATTNGKALKVIISVLLTCSFGHFFLWKMGNQVVKIQLEKDKLLFKHHKIFILSLLYFMAFGSYIGFSGVFPKLILDIFGYLPDGTENANAPSSSKYAWLGPILGSLLRPVGGMLSDKFRPSIITQLLIILLIPIICILGYLIQTAQGSNTPEKWFPWFFTLFLILFSILGMSCGSVFAQIAAEFKNAEKRGVALGWASAIASYGAYIIPVFLSISLRNEKIHIFMYCYGVFYAVCFFVNTFFFVYPIVTNREKSKQSNNDFDQRSDNYSLT